MAMNRKQEKIISKAVKEAAFILIKAIGESELGYMGFSVEGKLPETLNMKFNLDFKLSTEDEDEE